MSSNQSADEGLGASPRNLKSVSSQKPAANQIKPGRRRGNPHRSIAAQRGRRPLQAPLRAKVGQSAESTGTAAIHGQLLIVATTSRHGTTQSGQPQGEIAIHRGRRLTQATFQHNKVVTTGQPRIPSAQSRCFGIQRGEEATKKLLSLGLVNRQTPIAPKA